MTDSPQACPACGGQELLRVIYGLPDRELMQQERAGEILLGGCVVKRDTPSVVCRRCGGTAQTLEEADRLVPPDPPPARA